MAETATNKPNGKLADYPNGVGDPARQAESATGDVLPKDAGSVGANRITFEPTAQPITVTADDDGNAIDPNSIPDSEQKVRRRRSDFGTQRTTRKPRGSLAQTSNLEKVMLSMHLMAATFLHVPELRIDEQESAMLTKATLDVFKAYGVPDLTEKQVAIANMAMAVGTVYGPRFILVTQRKKHNRPKLVPFPATTAVQDTLKPHGPYTPTEPKPAAPNTNVVGAVSPAPPVSDNPGFISSTNFAADMTQLETV